MAAVALTVVALAAGVAATGATLATGADGVLAAAAGLAPPARIAAMISFVEPGLAAVGAGTTVFGGAGTTDFGTVAAGATVSTGAAMDSGAGALAAGAASVAPDAAAFCARIFARISEVEGFFSSMVALDPEPSFFSLYCLICRAIIF